MRFNEQVNIQAQTVSGGASAGVSQELSRWSQERQAEATRKNQEAAYLEGSSAEIERNEEGQIIRPEERKALFGFIGTKSVEAHNQGLRDAYIASIDRDNVMEISRLAETHAGSLEGFEKAYEGYRAGVVNNVDPDARAVIQDSMDGTAERYKVQLQSQAIQAQAAESASARFEAVEGYASDASRYSRSGNPYGAGDALEKARATVQSLYETGEFASQAEADAAFRQIEKESTEQGYLHGFDNMEPVEALSAIQEMEIPDGFSADEWEGFVREATTITNRRYSLQQAEQRALVSAASDEVDGYVKAVSGGAEISPQERDRVYSLAEQAGLSENLIEADKQASELRVFSVSSAADQAAMIQSLRDSGTVEAFEKSQIMENMYTGLQNEARRDGYSLGVRQGLITPVEIEPLNPASYALRREQSAIVSEHYGVQISPLSDAEADQLADSLPSMTYQEQMGAISAITEGLGDQSLALFSQMSEKNAVVFATAGAIGEPSVMSPILRGQEMINLGTAKKPTQAEYLDDFNSYVGDVYAGQNRQATLEAAIAHYVTKNNSSYDSGDFEQSLEAVTGGVGKVNGSTVELPRGVEERDLDRYFDTFSPAAVAHFGGVLGMTDEQASDAIQRGVPVSVGSNQYEIEFNGLPVKSQDGRNLVIQYLPDLAPSRQVYRR